MSRQVVIEGITAFSIFVLTVVAVSSLWIYPVWLTITLLVGCVLIMKFSHRKDDLIFFYVPLVLGPIGEVFCVRAGAWEYSQPAFLGLPIWLPLLWGLAGLVVARLVAVISKVIQNTPVDSNELSA